MVRAITLALSAAFSTALAVEPMFAQAVEVPAPPTATPKPTTTPGESLLRSKPRLSRSDLTSSPAEKPAKATAAAPPRLPKSVDKLIPWLLDEHRELIGIPFREVIFDATGKRVLAIDLKKEADRGVVKQLSEALAEAVKRMNDAASPIQNEERINETSNHLEALLHELLNATPGLSCDFPRTAAGDVQRSGYPDLRIVERDTKRVFYLDPKIHSAKTRAGTLRAFYFEPKVATNKVLEDAVHLVAGFEYEEGSDGHWNFIRWDLVDLANFRVRLKAEFQGSNRDIYRPDAIVATSAE